MDKPQIKSTTVRNTWVAQLGAIFLIASQWLSGEITLDVAIGLVATAIGLGGIVVGFRKTQP